MKNSKPEVYSPMWLNDQLNLPRDRVTINTWSRGFFALHPIVNETIQNYKHKTMDQLVIDYESIDDNTIKKFFKEQDEDVSLIDRLSELAHNYFLFGDGCIYMELSELDAKWKKLIIQDPDYLIVKQDILGDVKVSIRPDEVLRCLAIKKDKNEEEIQTLAKFDGKIIKAIENGENIELNPFYYALFRRRISAYETRGTGVIILAFRPLMMLDTARQAYFKKEKEYYDFLDEEERLINQIKSCIGHPDAHRNGISGEVILNESLRLANSFKDFLTKKYYPSISKINGFYKMVDGNKILMTPDVKIKLA